MESIVARGIAMIVTLLLLAGATILGYSSKNTATYQNEIAGVRQLSADIMMMNNESASASATNVLANLYTLQTGKYNGVLPGEFNCTSATACTDFNGTALTAGTSSSPYLFIFSLTSQAQCNEFLTELGATNFYVGKTGTLALTSTNACTTVPGTNTQGGYLIQ